MPSPRLLISSTILILLLAGCAQSAGPCPAQPPADLSAVVAFAGDSTLPFQFPLDELGDDVSPFPAVFCSSGGSGFERKYHAAEDYHRPAGTPVYAVAEGEISFSGPMGGYGWLIIIDHPQANLYSLYGHLSPSRWRLESGMVEKGELIAYLGDADENGGSSEHPLRPHLHFGLRAGQRADYSGTGEWRWQAGWIRPCPRDLGWLQPSAVIASQEIPTRGFPEPAAGFLVIWWLEIIFGGIYVFGGVCVLVFAVRRNRPFAVVPYSVIMGAAGWIFGGRGWQMSYVLFAVAALLLVVGIYLAAKMQRF